MSIAQNFSPFSTFVEDARNASRDANRWVALSWFDFSSRYRRTFVGAFWQTFETLLFVSVITLLLGTAFGRSLNEYAVYVAVGIVGWNVLSNAVSGGPRVFINHAGMIQNMQINLLGLVVRQVGAQFYQFCFDLPVALAAVIILAPGIETGFGSTEGANVEAGFSLAALTSVLAIIVFMINAAWISLFLGCVGVFFRGLRFALPAFMRFMFFTTPIFWYGDRGIRSVVAKYNPLAHFLEIFRGPLIGNEIDLVSWAVVGVVTLVGWIVAIFTYLRVRASIVFWL